MTSKFRSEDLHWPQSYLQYEQRDVSETINLDI